MKPLRMPSVTGAVVLARALLAGGAPRPEQSPAPAHSHTRQHLPALELPPVLAGAALLHESPTEQRNPRSLRLDRLSTRAAAALMLDEDACVAPALRRHLTALAAVADAVGAAFQKGGRLIYAGAGTSGRLGVLDASEIPPTFRAPREQVQGIIAGGRQALWSAVEGAEDDVNGGAAAIAMRDVGAADVVVGIAASGRTPFVWGALHEARRRGARTVLLCMNPAVKKAVATLRGSDWQPHHVIAVDAGPEVLTGSTRLKAGTATKLALNLISTLAMVRAGKVLSNLMVDLKPSNIKLRDRARRLVMEITGCDAARAQARLEKAGWVVKDACQS